MTVALHRKESREAQGRRVWLLYVLEVVDRERLRLSLPITLCNQIYLFEC